MNNFELGKMAENASAPVSARSKGNWFWGLAYVLVVIIAVLFLFGDFGTGTNMGSDCDSDEDCICLGNMTCKCYDNVCVGFNGDWNSVFACENLFKFNLTQSWYRSTMCVKNFLEETSYDCICYRGFDG